MDTQKPAAVQPENFLQRINALRAEIDVPKNQYNKFGNYYYRSCEDIYDALRPLEKKHQVMVNLTHELLQLGDKTFVKVVCNFSDAANPQTPPSQDTVAFVEIGKPKNGMSEAQNMGSVISYANKYALGMALLVGDVQDDDALNTHGKKQPKPKQTKQATPTSQPVAATPGLTDADWFEFKQVQARLEKATGWSKEQAFKEICHRQNTDIKAIKTFTRQQLKNVMQDVAEWAEELERKNNGN